MSPLKYFNYDSKCQKHFYVTYYILIFIHFHYMKIHRQKVKIFHAIFFIRIVNNDAYICVVTLYSVEIVKFFFMQVFSKNLKQKISITLTLITL
jgi:presenilin-like A22 family membrane protease